MRTFRNRVATDRLMNRLQAIRSRKDYPTDRIPDIAPSVSHITEDDMVILIGNAYQGLYQLFNDFVPFSIGDRYIIHRDKSKTCMNCCMFMNKCGRINCSFNPFIILKKPYNDYNNIESDT
jgi:hypothetical protein